MKPQRTLYLASLAAALLVAAGAPAALADDLTVDGRSITVGTPALETPDVPPTTHGYDAVATPHVPSQHYETEDVGVGPLCTVNACTTPVTTPPVKTPEQEVGTCPDSCVVVREFEILPAQAVGPLCGIEGMLCAGTGTLVPGQSGDTAPVESVEIVPAGSVSTPGQPPVPLAPATSATAGFGTTTVTTPTLVWNQLPPIDVVILFIEVHYHDTPSTPEPQGGGASSSVLVGVTVGEDGIGQEIPLIV